MTGDRRNMVVGPAAFVIAEEEDGIAPRRTVHKRIYNLRDLDLSSQNGCTGARMFVIVSVPGFDKHETRKRAIHQVLVIRRERRNVTRIDAEGVLRVAHHAGRLSGSCA